MDIVESERTRNLTIATTEGLLVWWMPFAGASIAGELPTAFLYIAPVLLLTLVGDLASRVINNESLFEFVKNWVGGGSEVN